MPVESPAPSYISDLNAAWPLSTDDVSEGDNHLRNIKAVLQASFVNATYPIDFNSVGVWGGISGTLSAQLDLQAELDAKLAVSAFTGHTHVAADVTDLQALLDAKAPLASPTFTGTAEFAGTTRFGDDTGFVSLFLEGGATSDTWVRFRQNNSEVGSVAYQNTAGAMVGQSDGNWIFQTGGVNDALTLDALQNMQLAGFITGYGGLPAEGQVMTWLSGQAEFADGAAASESSGTIVNPTVWSDDIAETGITFFANNNSIEWYRIGDMVTVSGILKFNAIGTWGAAVFEVVTIELPFPAHDNGTSVLSDSTEIPILIEQARTLTGELWIRGNPYKHATDDGRILITADAEFFMSAQITTNTEINLSFTYRAE